MARVAMVGNFGLEHKGTMRARALPLARALVRRGHQVEVYMPSRGEATGPAEAEGVHVRYIGANRTPGLSYLTTAAAMGRRALADRPDVIHAFKPISYAGLVSGGLAILSSLGRCGARVVVDADDWEGTGGWATLERRPRWLRWLIDRQERFSLRHNTAVTVASRHLETLLMSLGVPRDRVFYVPNGVESVAPARDYAKRQATRARLGLGGEARVILLYTRFVEYPLAEVARVFAQVAAREPNARLLVVGRGFAGEEAVLPRLLGAEGLTGRSVFAGWVQPDELGDYLAAADVGMYPLADTLVNRTKCPAKLVELMAAAVPVVAEDVGQAREYIESGRSGTVVPVGEVAAFAGALCQLLGDHALAEELGRGAASRIRDRFLWDHLAATVERAYFLAAQETGRVAGGARV